MAKQTLNTNENRVNRPYSLRIESVEVGFTSKEVYWAQVFVQLNSGNFISIDGEFEITQETFNRLLFQNQEWIKSERGQTIFFGYPEPKDGGPETKATEKVSEKGSEIW